MSIRFPIILSPLLLLAVASHAQDFDADSIYYTPIPKTAGTIATGASTLRPNPRLQFRDTVSVEKKIQYFFNVQVGSLVGCNDCVVEKEVTITSSTTHGVTIGKKLRTGVGLGFDSYYGWHAVPVFGSASWDIFGTRNTNALFVQLNVGWAWPWKTDPVGWETGFSETGTMGGRMVYALAGYRVKYHDMRIIFSIGAKFQQASYYYEFPTFLFTPNGTMIEGTPARTTVEESMSRLALTMTLGWK